MIKNEVFESMINAPVRAFRGRVEFYEGSALALMCGCHDNLKSFTVERVGESDKFFGYGVCQKINIKLIDRKRTIQLSTANTAEVVFGKDSDYIYPCPNFYISEVHRDETTNELSITAYDALYQATKHTVSELALLDGYTIKDFVIACGAVLGLPVGELDDSFNLYFENGANFDGTESIRTALNAVAEATQTIYYVDWDWKLTFKRLDVEGTPALTINNEKYFDLKSSSNRRLGAICHTTELGDNVIAKTAQPGTTQYVRDNPFWNNRDDVDALIEAGLNRIGGLTINQFDCNWRGNFLLEIGDKIELITKDNVSVYSYVLNDVMTFDGSLSQKTQWHYENNEEVETAANPVSIGDVFKQTYARVDKINQEIELAVIDISDTQQKVSSLTMTTDNITAAVERIETVSNDNFESVNSDIATLTKRVEATMTAEDVSIAIQTELSNGVESVSTTTGYRFDSDGLTVSKSGSEMTTQITEDGMSVYRDGDKVLIADNTGVKAENLHATTYLMIGANSRLEDYKSSRTGCFWIGG